MADCPGILHLAQMADGGLARLRLPGGALTAAQARAVACAAQELGSGEIDVTNRANLQIRGLPRDGGATLARKLEAAGFAFHGEAERRRNILLDPFSGLDSDETRDMRPLAAALDAAILAAPWIADLSPKFSFVLDGEGATGVSAAPADVTARAGEGGIVVEAGTVAVVASGEDEAVRAIMAVARAASEAGADVRTKDLSDAAIADALLEFRTATKTARPTGFTVRYGAVPVATGSIVALCLPVPVGRIDAETLAWLADLADDEGDGRIIFAPWSAAILPGVRAERAADLLIQSVAHGFAPIAAAERLAVVACAGAPSCERAQESAKTLGAAILRLAGERPDLLPARRKSLHLSACPKGCAGSAAADLLLLGASDRPGWALHPGGTPRAPGPTTGRREAISAAEALALLAQDG